MKKIKILEVNNIDLVGKRFNGYDLAYNYVGKYNKHYKIFQIVNFKSKNSKSINLYDSINQYDWEQKISEVEYRRLSVHSQLSISDYFLENKKLFQEIDLIHFHMYHNSKYSLEFLKKIAKNKKVVLTLHDMWFLTGRCVQPFGCEKWLSGCNNCENLNTMFPLHIDCCSELLKIKNDILKNSDIDLIVSSKFMFDSVNAKKIIPKRRIHLIPFGIDLNEFKDNGQKNKIRENFKIPKDNIVLFFRSQKEFKGIQYIVKALELLQSSKKITLISCGEIGLLKKLQTRYHIIEMGVIDTKKIIDCYIACDIFLMPSQGESFGLMAIEAMACSRPVIVFDNTALPSVTFAPECGVLVENKNSKNLKEAIENLINNDKERNNRGNLGRILAEKYYNNFLYNENIMQMYQKILKRNSFKNINSLELDINFEDKQAQKLLFNLKKVTKDLFYGIPVEFNEFFGNLKSYRFYNNKFINYSDTNLQKIIQRYNELLYLFVKTHKKIDVKIFKKYINKMKLAFFLLLKDRKKMFRVIKEKINIRRSKWKKN